MVPSPTQNTRTKALEPVLGRWRVEGKSQALILFVNLSFKNEWEFYLKIKWGGEETELSCKHQYDQHKCQEVTEFGQNVVKGSVVHW